jgi:uncharacterized iron-regulated membrane protein
MRALFVVHRYLGIALGFLMVMWCLSGVVMMYVSYPRLTDPRRMSGLAPLSANGCCTFGPNGVPDGDALADFSLEMLAGRLVMRMHTGRPVDVETGAAIEGISEGQAMEVAHGYAARWRREARPDTPVGGVGGPVRPHARPSVLAVVNDDLWTFSGVRAAERPLYRVALGDDAGTELYVSAVSGRAVQVTDRRQRFWNWLGAIPHWLYFASLRRRVRLWSAMVICAALGGCALAASGLVLGWRPSWSSRRPARSGPSGAQGPAPSRLLRWHHATGLVFGAFALTWVASGLLSMNPWGWLEGGGVHAERLRLQGPPPDAARTRAATLRAVAFASAMPAAVSVVAAPFAGSIYFVVEAAGGSRIRVDEEGRVAPLTTEEMARAASDLSPGVRVQSVERMTTEDAYFGRENASAPLPVYRVILSDGANTRYYVDPVSAEIEAKIDSNAIYYRWLYQGLHRWDGWRPLTRRPVWDVWMLVLLSGVLAVCATGTTLGWRRAEADRRPR